MRDIADRKEGIIEQEKHKIAGVMSVVTEQLESMFGSSSAGKSALLAWLTTDETTKNNAKTDKGKAKKNA